MLDWHTGKTVLAISVLVFWSALWMIHVVGIAYGYYKYHRRRMPLPPVPPQGADLENTPSPVVVQIEAVVGVSVIKPVVGTPVDPNLMGNLETFFTMSYPKFELLFCIQEDGDPSIEIVHELMTKYPNVNARVFTGGSSVGLNPKINNMHPGYDAAQYELVLVSDAGLMMRKDTLADMVSYMTPEIGIVHQMPFTCDRKGWPATLEKVYFGTGHARMYLFLGLLDAFGLSVHCCTGMSCLMRKDVLDDVGGIQAFGNYLAEDFFFAKHIQDKGWGIRISSQPAWQNSGIVKVKNFLFRLSRWCKLRIAMVPHTIILEPFSECIGLGLVASWAGMVLLNADYLVFLLIHVLVWCLLDWFMLKIVQGGPPPFSKAEFLISWVFREVSAIFVFAHAVWNPNIKWRDQTYKLRWWGEAESVDSGGANGFINQFATKVTHCTDVKNYPKPSHLSLIVDL